MIIGIIVLILSVLEFIRSFKVHGNDTVLQKIYYYMEIFICILILELLMLQRITFYYKEKYIESTQKNETIKVVKLKRIYRICRFGSVMCGISIITLVIVTVL
jgi:uncharacterized membrane protein